MVESQFAYPASLQALHSNAWKQIIQIEHNRIKNPNWQEATSRLFTSVAKDFNSGQLRTNPGSGQSRTWTRNCRIASLMRWPLGHPASFEYGNVSAQ